MESCWSNGYIFSDTRMLLQLMAFGLGMAHRSVKDDVYRGYYIPAGTLQVHILKFKLIPSGGATIIGNTW